MTRKAPSADVKSSVHVSIDVPELEAGLRFYGAVFGFVEKARPFPTMAILDASNVTVCMHEKAAGTRSSPGGADERRYERHWTPVHLDLHVPDLDAVLTKVRAGGGMVESEFRTQGPMPVAFCSDPFGNGFCVRLLRQCARESPRFVHAARRYYVLAARGGLQSAASSSSTASNGAARTSTSPW